MRSSIRRRDGLMNTRRRLRYVLGVIFALLLVVGVAAAVISFDSLTSLGKRSGFNPDLAWLLPIVVDAGAIAGTSVFLFTEKKSPPRRFGGWLGLGLLVLSILGNGTDHFLEAYSLPAPWWLIVIVAAIAPSVLATMVHLAGLLVRYIDVVSVGEPSSEPDEDLEELTNADQGPATFEEMMLAGWGYARVASALGIEKNEARKRVYAHRKSLEVQTEDAPDFERETEGAVS
jgi:hypothetical protein